jgi:Zn-dependent protease
LAEGVATAAIGPPPNSMGEAPPLRTLVCAGARSGGAGAEAGRGDGAAAAALGNGPMRKGVWGGRGQAEGRSNGLSSSGVGGTAVNLFGAEPWRATWPVLWRRIDAQAPLPHLLRQVTQTVQTPPAANPPQPANMIGAGLLLAWAAIGFGLQRLDAPPAFFTFVFVMLGWVLSVMAHEFSHACVAYLGGDVTVVEKGYLSFDPRRYGDVGVSVVLPLLVLALGGVALPGGAVWLRNDLMRSRSWRAAASLAGPAATLVILLVLASVLRIWEGAGAEGALFPALTLLAFLQAMALIFNLLPIPGLDGFNAIRAYMPASWAPQLRKAEGLAMGLLLIAIFVVPGVGAQLFRAAAGLSLALGLDPAAIAEGWRAFHFWR